ENRIDLSAGDEIYELSDGMPKRLFYYWVNIFLPAIHGSLSRIAEIQTQTNMAILALGLERYRLAHDGRYPETLEALSPDFLPAGWAIPHDLLTGDPLHYRRVEVPGTQPDAPAQSTYLLYAVGPNLSDDGGTVYAKGSSDDLRYDRDRTAEDGDWVWPTPAMSIKP
ncbi:MAG: hypothetical protein AAF975_08970, partial [Spirochaetota bacterium]